MADSAIAGRDMRRDDRARQSAQGVADGQRFQRIGDIERTAKPLASHFFRQCREVDQASAGDVDHDCAVRQSVRDDPGLEGQAFCPSRPQSAPADARDARGIEAGKMNWVVLGQRSRHVRVIDQPLQIKAAHQVHQRATDSSEPDHGDFASDQSIRWRHESAGRRKCDWSA